ncbi:NAD(P)H-binding protein [Streptomyces sp. NPDC005828]|uniref:NAD(P)H-binding protein n=1 Tax=Streptomyces sp. NPDC005828 TaxID=3157071 RepID=UPI0033CE7AFA
MSGRTFLVTGATGTVGRQVVARLSGAGTPVRAMARDPRAVEAGDGIVAVAGDLTDPDGLRVPLTGVDAVFLVWPFATADGAHEVLEVIAERARRVVYLSSAAPRDGERRVEEAIVDSGLEWTFLRPHVFASNALRWARQIREEGTVRAPYGAATTAPLHERDLAAVAVRALTDDGHAGASYRLTGPEALTQAEQVRIIGEVIDRPVVWTETPEETARQEMLAQGWPPAVVDGVLRAQAELVTTPGPLTSTVESVTGAPARTFRAWAGDHARNFLTSGPN